MRLSGSVKKRKLIFFFFSLFLFAFFTKISFSNVGFLQFSVWLKSRALVLLAIILLDLLVVLKFKSVHVFLLLFMLKIAFL